MNQNEPNYRGLPGVGNLENPQIILCSVNAGYIHANLGLRYLLANLGDFQSRACILEGTRRSGVPALAGGIVSLNPAILGVSVSIWNHRESIELIGLVRAALPGVVIILGGPEASYLPDDHRLFVSCDFLVRGEGEVLFQRLCRFVLHPPGNNPFKRPKKLKVFQGSVSDLGKIRLPYGLLSRGDVQNRLIYIETSRGCPFGCEFCLSSIQGLVRFFPLEPVLQEIRELYLRGGRYFKVIDRTFNVNIPRARATLEFFLELFLTQRNSGAYVQFEVVPDRLPAELRDSIARFPPGTLRLEVGIQTFNNTVAARINRRQNQGATLDNLEYLSGHTNGVLHADLIIGLPGEDGESFARGFDRLWIIGPGEIQLGVLKALPGTSLHRHDGEFGMVYNPDPPYEILETRDISRAEMDELKVVAKFWELIVNRGRYPDIVDILVPKVPGAFGKFRDLSRVLYNHFGKSWGIDAGELGRQLELYTLTPEDRNSQGPSTGNFPEPK